MPGICLSRWRAGSEEAIRSTSIVHRYDLLLQVLPLAPQHRKRGFGNYNPLRSELAENPGGLNRSVQHWLAVYSPAFESPRSLAGVG